MTSVPRRAPQWHVERWFNTRAAPSVDSLRGKVIVLEAFQMLCPACVSHGLPQAQRVASTFSPERVAVVGLHTVFEHHDAMTPAALQAFLHEYRIEFPVAVDQAGIDTPTPRTMQAYGMRGTPTLTLIDTTGSIRFQHFGQVSDLLLGAQTATLVAQRRMPQDNPATDDNPAARCDGETCPAPSGIPDSSGTGG